MRPLVAAGKRVGWGMADQALSSLTNFGVGVFLARSLPTSDFGAFGIGFSVYLLVLSLSRSTATEPLVIRFSTGSREEWRLGVEGATATATAIGCVAAAFSAAVSVATSGPLSATFLGLALCFPGLMLQDAWRFGFFALGEGRQAFMNDLVWAAVLIPGLAVLSLYEGSSILTAVLVWGGSATLAALVGIQQSRVAPDLGSIRSWLRAHRDLTPRFVAEELTVSAGNQLKLVALGFVANLVAVGAYRGAEVLLGPGRVLQMGVRMIAIPEAVRLLEQSTRRFVFVVSRASALLGGALLSVGLVIYNLPGNVGEALLGVTWAAARPVVLPLAIASAAAGTFLGAAIGLRALEAAKESLQTRVVFSLSSLSAAIVGGSVNGATGAAWSVAAISILGSGYWWLSFARVIRRLNRTEGLRHE